MVKKSLQTHLQDWNVAQKYHLGQQVLTTFGRSEDFMAPNTIFYVGASICLISITLMMTSLLVLRYRKKKLISQLDKDYGKRGTKNAI